MEKRFSNTKYMALLAIFVAIELVLGLVPMLGFIPINPAMQLTIVHIPVIIGAVLLGAKAGGLLGFIFGLTSFLSASFIQPNPIISPIFTPLLPTIDGTHNFWSLVVCFVPRIAVGLVSAWLFQLFNKIKFNEIFSLVVCGLVGSMANTVLVLSGIYFFFAENYAYALGRKISEIPLIIGGLIGVNGLVEAAVAAFATVLVAKPLLILSRKWNSIY